MTGGGRSDRVAARLAATDPEARSVGAVARAAIEAAEADGRIPTDRAEWLCCAAQEVADGRLVVRPDVESVRRAIIERANELLCVGAPLTERDLPVF